MNDPAVGVTVARHAPQPKLHSEKAHSVIPQNKVPRTQRPPDRHALNERTAATLTAASSLLRALTCWPNARERSPSKNRSLAKHW